MLKRHVSLLRTSKSFNWSIGSNKYHNGRKFYPIAEQVDSSIPTMDRILTILDSAVNQKSKSSNNVKETENFELHDLLGSTLQKYCTYRIFNDIDIVRIYHESSKMLSMGIRPALQNDAQLLSDNTTDYKELGKSYFIDHVMGRQKAFSTLQERFSVDIKKTSVGRHAFSKGIEKLKFQSPRFDFRSPNLPNPFRDKPSDPFIMRKALSSKKMPVAALAFLPNNLSFIERFLHAMNSKWTPDYCSDLMEAYELEGETAFRLMLIRHLKNTGSPFYQKHPLDDFGRQLLLTSWKLDIIKATIAARSNLLTRLWSFRTYSKSLSEMESPKSEELKILSLSRMFDRYFAMYCRVDYMGAEKWLYNVLKFFENQKLSYELLENFSKEVLSYFDETYTKAVLQRAQSYWKDLKKS